MTSQLTKAELAERLDVTIRTVTNWVQAGCPSVLQDGERRFVEADVRRWRAAQAPAPRAPVEPSPALPSIGGGTMPAGAAERADLAGKIARARRHELEVSQERGLKELGLDEKVRAARTASDLAEIAVEITALSAAGAITPARSHALRQLVAETRHSLSARERKADERGDGRLVLATEDACALVAKFDTLVNGWRRRWLLEALELHLAEDEKEFPGFDGGDLEAWLAQFGLDLSGDPVGERPAYMTAPVIPPARVPS
jgi:hypothetical protein